MESAWFYEKLVQAVKGNDDLKSYPVGDDPHIREVIRNLETKHIGKRILLDDTNPKNPSIKKWIKTILGDFPSQNHGAVEDLLNEFRSELSTRSKEQDKGVGLLLLNDLLFIAHFQETPSLAKIKDQAFAVELLLNPKNIYRAVIVKLEKGAYSLSAYEYNKKLTVGLASFLGIEPEDISWESTGSITLYFDLEGFDLPLHLELDSDKLDEMFRTRIITPSGAINTGKSTGLVTKAQIFGILMDFAHFYDIYATHKEQLEKYKKQFVELVGKIKLPQYAEGGFTYEEDEKTLFEITVSGRKSIQRKEHPRFTIIYATKTWPIIHPNNSLLLKISRAIFQNVPCEICHIGELLSDEPTRFGNLNIYNNLKINSEILLFSNTLLDLIQDTKSSKAQELLKLYYLELIIKNLENKHLASLFAFLKDELVVPSLIQEFDHGLINEKESLIEYKSADALLPKPSDFAKNNLAPLVKKYSEETTFKRLCIIYGIEDNGAIKPIYHIKNDQVTLIEKIANEELINGKAKVQLVIIPYKEASVVAVLIIPKKN